MASAPIIREMGSLQASKWEVPLVSGLAHRNVLSAVSAAELVHGDVRRRILDLVAMRTLPFTSGNRRTDDCSDKRIHVLFYLLGE